MAQRHEELDLAYRILDLDLVDSEGTRCGKVDDLELTGGPGETTYVAAIVTGTGALRRRFARPLRGLGARLFPEGEKRVRWSSVADFEAAVRLERTAAELGLGEGDRALARAFRRLG
jgi:hypothetical protein